MKAIDNKELILALEELEKEKGIKKEYVLESIETALVTAYKRNFDALENVKVDIDHNTGATHIYSIKEVMERANDDALEISLEDAHKINKDLKIGDSVEVEIVPKDFGRIAAQTAKQVIVQKLREVERDIVFDEYSQRKGEIVSGIIQKADKNIVIMDLGKLEGIMLAKEKMPTETYRVNDKIKAYIVDVERGLKGAPQVMVSRSHPDFVRKLLEFEIPEIYEGLIEIKAVSRDPGYRSKVAVYSQDPNIDPVGSCVGSKGVRIQNVINELHGEKIDVIEWDEDPSIFISAALLPAQILAVDIKENSIYSDTLEEKIKQTNEKVAYLTFDDGPNPKATPKILKILKKENVKATFFVIGKNVEQYPEIVKQEYEEGHYIANHGYSHNNKILYKSDDSFKKEIKKTDEAISQAIGEKEYSAKIFRFPNGFMSKANKKQKEHAVELLKQMDYTYIDWNCLNNDSMRKYNSSQLVSNLKKSIGNKEVLIILMHDTKDVSDSSEALENSIKYLKLKGYKFKNFYDE